jgi:hypothetical protein
MHPSLEKHIERRQTEQKLAPNRAGKAVVRARRLERGIDAQRSVPALKHACLAARRVEINLQRMAFPRTPRLGGRLRAVSSLHPLHALLSRAKIILVRLPRADGFDERFDPCLDGSFELPGFPGLP